MGQYLDHLLIPLAKGSPGLFISSSSCSPVPAWVPGPDGSLIAVALNYPLMKDGRILALDALMEEPSVADLVLFALNDVLCYYIMFLFYRRPGLLFGPVNEWNSFGLSLGGDR